MSTNRFTPHSARRKPLALGVAAVLALSASAVAHGATTWFVNDCTDGTNAGQFRWATNGAVSGDTIDLVTQLAPTYLNCAAGSNGFAHVLSVNSAVTVAGGVTIQGPGMNNLALSGTGVNRILVANGNIAVNDLGFKYGINTAVTTGGCIWANNNIALTNVRMYKCKGNSSTAAPAKGGSLYSNFGSVTLAGSTIDRGYATATANGNALGGSIYAFTTVALSNSTITSSTATTVTGSAAGGALFARGNGVSASANVVTLTNSSVSGTASVTGAGGYAFGGAIANKGSGITKLSGTSVENSTATTQTTGGSSALGGGIYSAGEVYLSNNSFLLSGTAYSKSGPARGGNVYSKGFAYVLGSAVQGGNAQRGGGIYALNGFSAKYSLINANTAGNGGAGVINKGGNSLVKFTTVSNNSGYGWSGLDLFAGGASTITIQNSTIVRNSGTVGNGALYLKSFHTTLDNSTVAYNTSPTGVPAVAILPGNPGSTFDMHSTIIASNASGSGREDLVVNSGSPFTGTSSNNFVRDPGSGVPAGTIVGQCPQLRQIYHAGSGSFWWAYFVQAPISKSPVIDHGSNPDNLSVDQRGSARVSGPAPDIGAYEVNQADEIFNNDFDGCLLN